MKNKFYDKNSEIIDLPILNNCVICGDPLHQQDSCVYYCLNFNFFAKDYPQRHMEKFFDKSGVSYIFSLDRFLLIIGRKYTKILCVKPLGELNYSFPLSFDYSNSEKMIEQIEILFTFK